MLLNKGPIANSMGLNPQATTQYAKPIRNFLTSPSTIAKGFGRLGGILSGLVHSNDAVAAEKPGFFDQLQKQGITQPHEQQQVMPQGQMRDARQALGSSFTEQEAMQQPENNIIDSWENRPQAFTGDKIDLAKITSPGGIYEWVDSDYYKNGGYIGSNEDFDWSTAQPGQGQADRDAFVDRLKYLESIGYFENDKGGTVENDFDYRSKSTYKLKTPEGETVTITGPKGSTKEQIIQIYLQKMKDKQGQR